MLDVFNEELEEERKRAGRVSFKVAKVVKSSYEVSFNLAVKSAMKSFKPVGYTVMKMLSFVPGPGSDCPFTEPGSPVPK